MNKQLLKNTTEDFILKYKAALKFGLTRYELAEYLNMKPKSLMRRKQEIAQLSGLSLPPLKLDKVNQPLQSKRINEFEQFLQKMAENFIKSEKVNDLESKTRVSIQKNKRYVVTSAQNNTPINVPFLKSLINYCTVNDAELLVIPYRYKNPTSVWSTNDRTNDVWHPSLSDYLLNEELKIGKHVRIMGNIKIQPTATSPLSGFDSVSGIDSAIFGHPNIELKTIPAVPGKVPKILATTGSVTIPNYTDSKAGHKGAYHHNFSAILIEIDDHEIFHIRHLISNNKDGSFYDLDKKYLTNAVEYNCRPIALVAGDIHAEVVSEEAKEAIFTGINSIASQTNPKSYVLHDIVDGSARSHHNIRDSLGRFRKHLFNDNNNVEESLQKVANFLEDIYRDDTNIFVVKSNHDEHIDRWLREADPNLDPENARFYHYLRYHQYKHICENKKFDIIEFWGNNPDQYRGIKPCVYDKTHFLSRGESMELAGVEVSLHGDMGPNGARGTLRNLSKLGQKLVIGHSHTPGIINGSYQVGTTSELRLDYNVGPSSWLHTSALIYPDGNVTLINVINGRWKI